MQCKFVNVNIYVLAFQKSYLIVFFRNKKFTVKMLKKALKVGLKAINTLLAKFINKQIAVIVVTTRERDDAYFGHALPQRKETLSFIISKGFTIKVSTYSYSIFYSYTFVISAPDRVLDHNQQCFSTLSG